MWVSSSRSAHSAHSARSASYPIVAQALCHSNSNCLLFLPFNFPQGFHMRLLSLYALELSPLFTGIPEFNSQQ
ncbi:TPA: hypothetical protein PY603_002780 [Staphylococcus aureus]|nr:hypothetical protein [Staphylococcus aureus]